MSISRLSPLPLRIVLIDDSPCYGHGLLFANLVRDRAFSHGVELAGYYALDESEGEAWCRTHQIPWVGSPAEFAGRANAVIIPAATTPESHLPLLRAAAPLRLPVYLDKPLARTEDEGSALYALAREYGIPLMSASALRFSQEVRNLKKRFPAPQYVEIWSGWRDKFDEFFIHAAELFTSLARNAPSDAVRQEISSDLVRYELSDPSGVIGAIHLSTGEEGFSIMISDGTRWQFETIRSSFFVPTIEAVIAFLRSGMPEVDEAEALQSLQLIDRCRDLNLSALCAPC